MPRSCKDYVLPADATVHESSVRRLGEGFWFAGLRVSIPGQGGYDCPDYDDIFRTFTGQRAEQDARQWLDNKLNRRST